MEPYPLKLVDYSEWELLILYNYIPRLINQAVIAVNISSNYYTSGSKEVLLTEDAKGSYWIISTKENIDWLLPDPKLIRKLNPHSIQSVKLLFKCQNYEESDSGNFILKKLAKVTLSMNRQDWILEEPGFLDFGDSLSLDIEQIQKSHPQIKLASQPKHKDIVSREEFEETINQAEVERNQLQLQIQQLIETQVKIQSEFKIVNEQHNTSVRKNQSQIQQLMESQVKLQSEFQVMKEQYTTLVSYYKNQIPITSPSQVLFNYESQLVATYNSNPHSLLKKAITVSETYSTFEKRRNGYNIKPILEESNPGYCWIIKEGNEQYLVPKDDTKINERNFDLISVLFNCIGYQQRQSNNFILLKPAKVSSKGKQWEFIEAGEIRFELEK